MVTVQVKKAQITILGILFLLLSTTAAMAVPIISVTPSTSSVNVGEFFTIDIGITGVTNLHSFEFDVDFDSAVLDAVSVVDGGFLPLGFGIVPPIEVENNIAAPDVNFAMAAVGFAGSSGSGLLATITFEALAGGTSVFNLNDVILSAPFGIPIFLNPGNINNGLVNVVSAVPAVPEPSTILLLGFGLTALVVSKYRKEQVTADNK